MLLKHGDKFTMHGRYKKRTFLQWLRKDPKVLQEYIVVAEHPFGNEFEPLDNPSNLTHNPSRAVHHYPIVGTDQQS